MELTSDPDTALQGARGRKRLGRRRAGEIAGLLATLLAVAYAFTIHNGLGIAPHDNPTQWWHATGFLLDYETVDAWLVTQDAVGRRILYSPGIVYLSLPALALILAAFALTASAVARAIACSAFFAVPIFAFYGLTQAIRIWEFFHWRGSVVIALTGLALGSSVAAPFLARSWLRQPTWLRVAIYLPVFAAVVCLIRHATGTDEQLPFNFSPWPAVPVFGLEIGAYIWLGVLWGLGLALGAASIRIRHPLLAAVGVVVGLALPAIWYSLRFGPGPVPLIAGLVLATAIALVLSLFARGPDRDAKRGARALATLVGATLAFAPLATGRALATGDYTVNKFVRSQVIIDALAKYYESTDEGYPDELQAVVDAGFLAAIPQPRVGFDLLYALGWLDRFDFFYQSLGSSYVLEFTSTEWVQCAYNPPWADDDEFMQEEDDFGAENAYADDSADAWSCPDQRPELW